MKDITTIRRTSAAMAKQAAMAFIKNMRSILCIICARKGYLCFWASYCIYSHDFEKIEKKKEERINADTYF